ncbi:DNA primase [Acetobacteraceae bacterium ESL0709]|nr:DNA primase [Acetobacteraceae bacterium ESL0697]MDF7678607.1 DNA primase [Acetobacteraceae bacterium ESL0709]
MALDSAFLDELRQRVTLVSLIGRSNKLVRSGRNWKTCCPFHGEKTPSFYIYEDHFHCFGCGVHGDAISYVMQSEGLSFRDAVERLAHEAGLEMPREDPRAEEKARQVASLEEIMQHVQAFYRRNLGERQGEAARHYLQKRGLTAETITRFGLGWSGDGRSLTEALKPHDITPEQLAQLGLLRCDEQGAIRGELFFNRLMFPIHDRKGRLISFGGRILGEGQPKYVNGPETVLFSKKRTLFNLHHAAEAVRKGAELVVVEGYMDVIALDQAGFRGAVAPLGTALGEEQLALLWRQAKAPIICLDGDIAGQKAALRSCELALPLISPERTLRFCRLGNGDDPDSLVQRDGAQAFDALLQSSRPLVEELFSLMVAGKAQAGPEERAVIRKRLVELAHQIPDRALAGEYRSTLLDLFFSYFRNHRSGRISWQGSRKDPVWTGESKAMFPGTVQQPRMIAEGASERLKVLMALLIAHPEILPQIEQSFYQLTLSEPLAHYRSVFLEWASQTGTTSPFSCQNWMKEHGLGELTCELLEHYLPQSARNRPVGKEAAREEKKEEKEDLFFVGVAEMWWHFYGLVNFPAFKEEVERAVREAILKSYERPLDESSGNATFPPEVKAKMQALKALQQGEN